jgi:hypothetical protein
MKVYSVSLILLFVGFLCFKFYSVNYSQKSLDLWDVTGDLALSAAIAILSYLFSLYNESDYKVSFVIFQNLSHNDIKILFGDAEQDHIAFNVEILIKPGEAISRKISGLYPVFSSISRPCAQIIGNDNKQLLIYIWQPSDNFLTKLITITDEGISEISDPPTRSWHIGQCHIHSRKEKTYYDDILKIFSICKRFGQLFIGIMIGIICYTSYQKYF